MQNELEKNLLQQYENITDIYGSARLPKENKWSIMPKNTPHDHIRNKPQNHCECQPLECIHFLKGANLMVDVVYYMDPVS